MFKPFLILFVLLLSVTSKADPSDITIPNLYFFDSSWGERVVVHLSGSPSNPDFTFETKYSSISGKKIFREYIGAVLDRRMYRYVIEPTCPSGNCHIPLYLENVSDSFITPQSSGTKKEFKKNAKDTINKIVENVAERLGSRSGDAIMDQLLSSSAKTQETSKFTILVNADDKPISMCKLTSNATCDPVDEVDFTHIDGGWIGTLPFADFGEDLYDYNRQIHDTINVFIRARKKKTRCTTVYIPPATPGGEVQIIVRCFPAY